MAYLKSFDFNTLKKNRMGRGQTHKHTNTQTHRRTSRLLDQIGPVGRFGENYIDIFSLIPNLEGHLNGCIGSTIMAILLNGWIWPTAGVTSGRVCLAACAAGLFPKTPKKSKTPKKGQICQNWSKIVRNGPKCSQIV